ncbi:nucleolar MIF4G domain-containing protein 1 [Megalops cyprinoides]|uniref:nucleolar MIF4G domain-containing protein 1 n=1 Tax=Megalops cyprinoides TaxID=118141 RepID=UPI0018649DEE|nr:nucleolar MIF4G domain-containing protein 1 [Megalops cyprinoides]
MKRKAQGKWKGKGDTGKLQKYMISVDEFVQSKIGSAEDGENRGHTIIRKKSRKELRKEKRKLKKLKMKNYYEGNKHLNQTITANSEGSGSEKVTTGKSGQATVVKDHSKKGPEAKPKKNGNINAKAEGVQNNKPRNQSKETVSKKGTKKKSRLQETRKQALLEANAAEDKEIKKLERYLGLNKRKNKKTLPQSFAADGLDYILGVLEPGASGSGMFESDEEMEVADAQEKLKKLEDSESELSDDGEEQDDSASDGGDNIDSDKVVDEMDVITEEEEEEDEEAEEEEDEEAEDDSDGGSECETEDQEEEEEEEITNMEETREVDGQDDSATQKSTSAPGKYVPPHLREAVDGKRKVELERLKRNVKGLVNRLSEPNLASISSQLEELYMSHSRKDMNDTLTEVLLAACVTPALMPDRLLMEHVLLVSVLQHTVGLEVGAQFLETVVRRFEEVYRSSSEGKECDNLVAIVAHLYNFHVVHALLIFDILKKLTASFTERDIELILFVLKNVGFALRKDDATSLKELISEAQRKANSLGAKFQDQSRVRFMLETMLALKNNDMRKIPGYDPEPVERLRKLQRTLVHNSSGGSDTKLRVTLENLLAAEQVGRWWIVGSSWSGAPMIGDSGNKQQQSTSGGQFSATVLDLARKQRMNTDIRRNIFCVLMTSEDYLDAFEKLLRLGLKDQQEREIVHVLMDCCLQEKTFNAFYAVLGEKFCSYDRRFQMTFQFSLWDKFKDLSSLSGSSFSNLVQLVVRLVQKKSLSLSILKAIEFGELDKPKVRFLRQVLSKLLTDTDPEELANIFGRISGIPKLGMLREGLKLFISHFLLKNVQSQGTAEQARLLSERAEVAAKAMEAKDAKLKL